MSHEVVEQGPDDVVHLVDLGLGIRACIDMSVEELLEQICCLRYVWADLKLDTTVVLGCHLGVRVGYTPALLDDIGHEGIDACRVALAEHLVDCWGQIVLGDDAGAYGVV